MLPDAIDLTSIHRVLVVKLRHHGDVLLTSPVFTVLKNHIPHADIDALVYADTADMLNGHPAIGNVFGVGRDWKRDGLFQRYLKEWRLLQKLRSRHYDLVIHLTESPRGAWLVFLLGARHSVARDYRGKRGRWWRSTFSHLYQIPARPRHTVEVHLDALRRIGIQPGIDERDLVLVPGADAERSVESMLRQNGLSTDAYAHLHFTSRWMFKCWPVEHVAALTNQLQQDGLPVVLTAAPSEKELQYIAQVRARLRHPVVDLSGKLNLKELAALTARARIFIGVDSAPMHMAAAMGTPVVALFGPSGEIEWGPWQTSSRTVTSNHSCRPCGLDGCGNSKVSECLTTLPVDAVLSAARQLLL